MRSRWLLFLLAACSLAPAAWAQLPFFGGGKSSGFKTYGRITSFQLDVPLATAPLAKLSDFPLRNFTYALYPTAASGAEGMIPGDTASGAPLMIPVSRGLYDHHTDTANPIEFEVIKGDAVTLPKAPAKQGLLVYSVLYSGDQLANCTGVVQLMELKQGQLVLAEQFSYDCRGGAGAEWNAKKRQLTVRSARYSLGDKPCCPSRYDSVVFKLDGREIGTGDKVLYDR
jgi:hypothetical protein